MLRNFPWILSEMSTYLSRMSYCIFPGCHIFLLNLVVNVFVTWSYTFWKPRVRDNLGNPSTENELHRSVNSRNEIWKFCNFKIFEESIKQKFWALGLIPQQVLQLYLALQILRVEGKIRSENFGWGEAEVSYVFQKYSLLADPIYLFHQSWNVGPTLSQLPPPPKKNYNNNKNCPSRQSFRRKFMSSRIWHRVYG